jgi:hypothetical protein
MSAFVLVSGSLFRAPEQRTSKAGKLYVTATIKARDGDALQFWRVTGFSDSVQTELMRLGDSDAVSVQGGLKAELYAKDGGEQKLSLSIIAEHVLPLRQPRKPREPDSDKASPRERTAGADRPFDDPIPY